MVSHTTRLVCYAIPLCPGPSHPDTKVRYLYLIKGLSETPGTKLEAGARGRFEGLLGVVAEVVVAVQPAACRCKREGARPHATHPWAKESRSSLAARCVSFYQLSVCLSVCL